MPTARHTQYAVAADQALGLRLEPDNCVVARGFELSTLVWSTPDCAQNCKQDERRSVPSRSAHQIRNRRSVQDYSQECHVLTSRELKGFQSGWHLGQLRCFKAVSSLSWINLAKMATHPVRQMRRCYAVLCALHFGWSTQQMWWTFSPEATPTEYCCMVFEVLSGNMQLPVGWNESLQGFLQTAKIFLLRGAVLSCICMLADAFNLACVRGLMGRPKPHTVGLEMSSHCWRLGLPLWGTALLIRHAGYRLSGVPGSGLRFGEAALLMLETGLVFMLDEGLQGRQLHGRWSALDAACVCAVLGLAQAYKLGLGNITLGDALDAVRDLPFLKSLVGRTNAQSPPDGMPIAVVPEDLEAQLEECYDMKCSITFGLLVHPVSLRGRVFERAAITKWIRARHTVPHSPATPANLVDLQPMSSMSRLLADFRKDYGIHVEYEHT